MMHVRFWSSVDLTGNQTTAAKLVKVWQFWSSVDLTGNQTATKTQIVNNQFWSSVDLTGNQTCFVLGFVVVGFGAVSI